MGDRFHVVADRRYCTAPLAQLPKAGEALLLEEHVADGERLVHDVDVGLEVGEEREGEADEHAGRVLLDGPVDELADLGEVEDRGQTGSHLGVREAQQPRALEDVLPSGQLGVKAGAQLEERGDPPLDLERPLRRIEGAREDLEQRALPRPVDPDDADALPSGHVEAHPFRAQKSWCRRARPAVSHSITRSQGCR